MDHLFPRLLNGPDDEKNIIWVCKECNFSKGSKGVYELWTNRKGLEGAKYEVPRIAEGKYLKLIFETMKERGMLDFSMSDIRRKICPRGDLKTLCIKEKSVGGLSPLCLDGMATLFFKDKMT